MPSRDAQLATKGSVATDKSSAATTRNQVETQLMKSLLTIALDHISDAQGGLAYLDQSIIRADEHASATPSTTPNA